MSRIADNFIRTFIPRIKRTLLKSTHIPIDSRSGVRTFHSSSRLRGSSLWRRYGASAAVVVCGVCVGVRIWWQGSLCQGTVTGSKVNRLPRVDRKSSTTQTLEEAIKKSEDYLLRIKDETGSPGIVVAVSVDGHKVWSVGLGFSDVENRVLCTPETVMRIASISKPITATIVGRLMEQGLLDIDAPVQTYLPAFPSKLVSGQEVTITTRNALTHTSGIRHYGKDFKDVSEEDKKSEFEEKEYYIKKHFCTVEESLQLFQHDPLVHKPGTKFLYTTHGYTLVSAVIESVMKKPFREVLQALFKDLGLQTTYLDLNSPLIYNRSRYYVKNKAGRLVNAPYVDLSYKWAGGGLLSTAGDLIKFGNVMLYSYQYVSEGTSKPPTTDKHSKPPPTDKHSKPPPTDKHSKPPPTDKHSKPPPPKGPSNFIPTDRSPNGGIRRNCKLRGYLKHETVEKLWSIEESTRGIDTRGYGLGWSVVPEQLEHGCGRHQPFYVSHTGGAVGASSALVIVPRRFGDISGEKKVEESNLNSTGEIKDCNLPLGVVVAIMTNMISVSLKNTALQIAQEFESVES